MSEEYDDSQLDDGSIQTSEYVDAQEVEAEDPDVQAEEAEEAGAGAEAEAEADEDAVDQGIEQVTDQLSNQQFDDSHLELTHQANQHGLSTQSLQQEQAYQQQFHQQQAQSSHQVYDGLRHQVQQPPQPQPTQAQEPMSYDELAQAYQATCSDFQQQPLSLVTHAIKAIPYQSHSLLLGRADGSSNPLTDEGVSSLFEVLTFQTPFTRIQHIDLSFNVLKDNAVQQIAMYMGVAPHLTSIDLSGNELTSSCGEKLGMALMVQAQNMHKYLTVLQQVQARKTYQQQYEHAEEEDQDLPPPPPQLVKLNLNTNPIGPMGIKKITDALLYHSSLTDLNLGHCDLNLENLIHLANVLSTNRITLKKLNLDHPLFDSAYQHNTSHHLTILSTALSKNTSLMSLSLSYHFIQDGSCYNLSRALKKHPNLRELNLKRNAITLTGVEYFIQALKNRYHPMECYIILDANKLKGQTFESLHELINSTEDVDSSDEEVVEDEATTQEHKSQQQQQLKTHFAAASLNTSSSSSSQSIQKKKKKRQQRERPKFALTWTSRVDKHSLRSKLSLGY